MFTIEFYEDNHGNSSVLEFLEGLRVKSATNKDARIQFRQMGLYIELLQNNGTNLPKNITKHIQDDIWELRPGKNRILYFFYSDDVYVLLHCFRKKTKKTPPGEIVKAKFERDDYLRRKDKLK